jgi:hypothetical protein
MYKKYSIGMLSAKVMIRSLFYLVISSLPLHAFSQPKAEFTSQTVDFGTVIEGTVCKYTFKFKNTGNKPLIISNVSVTCGCTVPRWSPQPVPAGDTSSIFIEFNTFNKMGLVEKGVNLTTNQPDPMIGLIIIARVIPDPNFVATIDSVSLRPFYLIDQKSFSQIKIPVKKLYKKKFRGDGYYLETIVKKILTETDKTLQENIWYTTTTDELTINTFSKDIKQTAAKILHKELSKKRKVKKWMKKVKS